MHAGFRKGARRDRRALLGRDDHQDKIATLDLLGALERQPLTTPATGAVIDASIFIASMVATVGTGLDLVALADLTVTTPSNGAATCPGFVVSAFSASATSDRDRRGRARGPGRSWPLIVHITVRMPRSSALADRLQPEDQRLPPCRSRPSCSSPGCSP